MPYILRVLAALGVVAVLVTVGLGCVLADVESVRRHLLVGVLTTIFLVFTHSLVLFYLIGTGIDIREAVEDEPGLRERFHEHTRILKERVFPWACAAAALAVVAALLGAEVHSRIISAAVRELGDGAHRPDAAVPLRSVAGWWVHPAVATLAVIAQIVAFAVEIRAARDNRRGIQEINAYFAEKEALTTRSETS